MNLKQASSDETPNPQECSHRSQRAARFTSQIRIKSRNTHKIQLCQLESWLDYNLAALIFDAILNESTVDNDLYNEPMIGMRVSFELI